MRLGAFFGFAFGVGLAACGSTSDSTTGGDSGLSDGGGGTGCHSDNDCNQGAPSFETCARVEDPQCGGAAPQRECVTDGDCADAGADAGALICVTETCGASRCSPRCTSDTQCGTTPAGALTCSTATGQCQAKSCAQTSECPTNYACNASHACAVKTCNADSDCAGACVNHQCSSAVGICRAPAA